jgi:hypothetical protein
MTAEPLRWEAEARRREGHRRRQTRLCTSIPTGLLCTSIHHVRDSPRRDDRRKPVRLRVLSRRRGARDVDDRNERLHIPQGDGGDSHRRIRLGAVEMLGGRRQRCRLPSLRHYLTCPSLGGSALRIRLVQADPATPIGACFARHAASRREAVCASSGSRRTRTGSVRAARWPGLPARSSCP